MKSGYKPRANPPKGPPTKEEHDAWVEAHGHPYTEKWMPWYDRPARPLELAHEHEHE